MDCTDRGAAGLTKCMEEGHIKVKVQLELKSLDFTVPIVTIELKRHMALIGAVQ